MSFEADLITRIVALGLPGIGADQVSWLQRRRDGTFPAITVQRLTPGRDYTMDGANALHSPRLQINIMALSPAEAEAIEDALIPGLEPAATVGGTKFGPGFLNGSPDLEPERLDDAVTVFRRSPDMTLWHEPA